MSLKLNSYVMVSRAIGVSDYGDRVYSDPVKVDAYVEWDSMHTQGENRPRDFVVTVSEIQQGDLVWLPGADPTNRDSAKNPLAIRRFMTADGSRVHHFEVEL